MRLSSRHHPFVAVALAGAVTSGSATLAQSFTIRDGCRSNIARYDLLSIPGSPTDPGATADMNANPCTAGFGSLYSAWIFYQVLNNGAGGSDPVGRTFNNANSQLAGPTVAGAGNAMQLSWANVDGRGLFAATYDIGIACCGSSCGTATHAVTLRSLATNPIRLSLFAYADIDLNGSLGDDFLSAFSSANRHIVEDTDPCGGCFEFRGTGAAHFHAGAYPSVENRILMMGSPLPDTGLGAGAQDYTGALEWIVTINPGQTFTARFTLGHNCLGCDGPAAAVNYGQGYGGNLAVPTLISLDPPVPGCPIDVEITGPANAPVLLLVGSDQIAVSLPGCPEVMLASPSVSIAFVSDPVGDARFRLPAVCDPSLCGDNFYLQAWVLAPGSGGCLGMIDSAGLRFTVGSR